MIIMIFPYSLFYINQTSTREYSKKQKIISIALAILSIVLLILAPHLNKKSKYKDVKIDIDTFNKILKK